MAWHDRDYNRETGGGGGGGFGRGPNGALSLMNWSFPIGTVFAIQVRVHITFVLLVVFEIFGSANKLDTLRWTGLLFVSVLLHEFGHCLACRKVGGTANEILMWPLGGLAFCAPPKRASAEFWTVAWGPLVTLILAIVGYTVLSSRHGFESIVSLNPWQMLNPHWFLRTWGVELTPMDRLFLELYFVNYGLFLFNLLLVFYPFDGGRIVQTVLWMFIGYYRSMWFATRFGIFGAMLAAGYAVYSAQLFLLFIAVFGGFTCWQQMQMLKHEENSNLYAAAYETPLRHKQGWLATRKAKRLAARRSAAADREDRLQAEVDRVLDKVRANGLHSLTRSEKRTLQEATEKQRRGE